MTEEQRLAITEGWLSLQDNAFWQFFWQEMLRKKDYLLNRLAEADSWEEICRIQGGLAVCRQFIILAEDAGKGAR